MFGLNSGQFKKNKGVENSLPVFRNIQRRRPKQVYGKNSRTNGDVFKFAMAYLLVGHCQTTVFILTTSGFIGKFHKYLDFVQC